MRERERSPEENHSERDRGEHRPTDWTAGQQAAPGNQSGYDKQRQRWNMSTDRQPDNSARVREAGETQHGEIGRERPRGERDRDTYSAIVLPGRVADRRRGQSTNAERRNHRRVSPEVRGAQDSCCERNQGTGENRNAEWQQAYDRSRLHTH